MRVICARRGLAGGKIYRKVEEVKEVKLRKKNLFYLFNFFDFAVKHSRVQEYGRLAERAVNPR
jgi:hypothetical protein